MINFNLAGDALVHCLKVSGAKIVLIDEDDKIQGKIDNERSNLEQEVGMKLIVLNKELKRDVMTKTHSRPDDSYREGVKGTFPAALFYTRYEWYSPRP